MQRSYSLPILFLGLLFCSIPWILSGCGVSQAPSDADITITPTSVELKTTLSFFGESYFGATAQVNVSSSNQIGNPITTIAKLNQPIPNIPIRWELGGLDTAPMGVLVSIYDPDELALDPAAEPVSYIELSIDMLDLAVIRTVGDLKNGDVYIKTGAQSAYFDNYFGKFLRVHVYDIDHPHFDDDILKDGGDKYTFDDDYDDSGNVNFDKLEVYDLFKRYSQKELQNFAAYKAYGKTAGELDSSELANVKNMVYWKKYDTCKLLDSSPTLLLDGEPNQNSDSLEVIEPKQCIELLEGESSRQIYKKVFPSDTLKTNGDGYSQITLFVYTGVLFVGSINTKTLELKSLEAASEENTVSGLMTIPVNWGVKIYASVGNSVSTGSDIRVESNVPQSE
jgi:hypothetical protein